LRHHLTGFNAAGLVSITTNSILISDRAFIVQSSWDVPLCPSLSGRKPGVDLLEILPLCFLEVLPFINVVSCNAVSLRNKACA
jgi:hypothetical protein